MKCFRYLACTCFLFGLLNYTLMAQSSGALSGRIVYTSGGHGWTNHNNNWKLQRPLSHEMIEDYGNHDQATLFAEYCFNAGATVVPLRPIGHQTNEVVLDNTSPAVTFTGSWLHVTNEPVYFGSAGSGFYQATASQNENATATFTPTIPLEGFYPVYTWVPHGANRTNQLYRIRHTGGESLVRVPHHMVGNGWIYLGTYFFQAGSHSNTGSVVVSNLQPNADPSSVVIADAIRFGNGMSESGSAQPREDEGASHWVQSSLGHGQSSSLYSMTTNYPGDADRSSRPKMIREMNREQAGATTKRVYISFHSNAFDGNTRGALALYHSTNATPNQVSLASICGTEVNRDMWFLGGQLENPWFNRTSVTLGGVYYEIADFLLGSEMDATIIEVAFHDNLPDARLMRDPKARTWIGRASYHAVVKYMNQFDGGSLDFLPEPPTNVRAISSVGGIDISWNIPPANPLVGWGTASNYRVYVSTNGYGFGNPVEVSGGSTTNVTLAGFPSDTDLYFRVTTVNAGGESLPSAVVGCRRSSDPTQARTLFVNGFTRLDRITNLRQDATPQLYHPPGNTGAFERVVPRWNNSFDYVVQHGKAISAFGLPFDSCHKDAVSSGLVNLTNYLIVVWGAGQELRANFNTPLQTKLTQFLANQGNFFLSGSEIAGELDRASGPSNSDRQFFNNFLRADLADDTHTNAGIYNVSAASDSIFVGNSNLTIDDGTKGIYWVKSPEILTPFGDATRAGLSYIGSSAGAAAIEYSGSPSEGRVVYFGFPFETITSEAARTEYMADILNFLGAPTIRKQPASTHVTEGETFTLTVAAQGINQLAYQWTLNGTNIANATDATFTGTNAQPDDAGEYAVTISNSAGSVLSSNALLNVKLRGRFESASIISNQIHLTFAGETNSNYLIQTSTNLVHWIDLTNVMVTNGAISLTEELNHRHQFFRSREEE